MLSYRSSTSTSSTGQEHHGHEALRFFCTSPAPSRSSMSLIAVTGGQGHDRPRMHPASCQSSEESNPQTTHCSVCVPPESHLRGYLHRGAVPVHAAPAAHACLRLAVRCTGLSYAGRGTRYTTMVTRTRRRTGSAGPALADAASRLVAESN